MCSHGSPGLEVVQVGPTIVRLFGTAEKYVFTNRFLSTIVRLSGSSVFPTIVRLLGMAEKYVFTIVFLQTIVRLSGSSVFPTIVRSSALYFLFKFYFVCSSFHQTK